MGDVDVPVSLRLPPEMLDELRAAAAANERTLSAEIRFRLRS